MATVFKKKKRKGNQRVKAKVTLEELAQQDEDVDVQAKLEEALEDQRMRRRDQGVAANGEEPEMRKPAGNKAGWSADTGGLATKSDIVMDRDRDREQDDARIMKGIHATFATGTGERDQDQEMLKFIEDRLQAETGVKATQEKQLTEYEQKLQNLYSVPEQLQPNVAGEEEDGVAKGMLSNSILSGIPEVELGLDVKIKNIEETEAAKSELLRKQQQRRGQDTAKMDYSSARFRKISSVKIPTPVLPDETDSVAPMINEAQAQKEFHAAKKQAMHDGKMESATFSPKLPSDAKRRQQQTSGASDDKAYVKFTKKLKRV